MLPAAGQSRLLTPCGALAALPTEIQDDVLARLPARDVVRTSTLSSAWRGRWESVPGLDVDLDLVGVRSWATAIGVLERCAAPIGRVRIRGVPPGLADGWLRLAAAKSPRSVSLDLPAVRDPPAAVALLALFSCDPAALAELRLGSCALPAPPVGFAGFHALATLDLERVFFLADNGWRQVEAMLAAAPGLQELRLKDIVFHVAAGSLATGKWVIGGPSLRRLLLCLGLPCAGSWELGALPKLEYAHVYLNDAPSDRDYVQLFKALSTVRELKITNFDCATHWEPIIPKSLSPSTFQNLRVLKLGTNFCVLSTYISTYYLLCQAPLLQVLQITDYYIRDANINEANLVAGCMNTSLPYSTLLHNLEHLRMINISCSENDMCFIKHALHKARYLQEVFVEMFAGSKKSCQETYRELKECQRASPAARISIKHGDSVCNV